MNNSEIFIAIAIMSIISYFTRALPFIFFRNKEELPHYFLFIGKYFPSIIITILIVFTLKDVDFSIVPYGLKEIVGVFVTAILHLLFKNYLISIFLGTVFYMSLIQLI